MCYKEWIVARYKAPAVMSIFVFYYISSWGSTKHGTFKY